MPPTPRFGKREQVSMEHQARRPRAPIIDHSAAKSISHLGYFGLDKWMISPWSDGQWPAEN